MTQQTQSVHGKEIVNSNPESSNVSSPYFSHHSDHPGLILISKPLNGNNYSTWRRVMSLALNSKNKLGFVDGSIIPPSPSTDPENYASWSRCNDMVHSWIINTINPEISDSVIYYNTAFEVWEDLRERFSQSNAPRIFEIQREISYSRQEHLSVSLYYTKLKGLWDELSSYTDSIPTGQQEQQKLMQFLMGLNDTYSGVRGQILLMNPLPSVRQAYSSNEVGKSDTELEIFSFNQMLAATNDFIEENKLGDGGFGPVYKALLPQLTPVRALHLQGNLINLEVAVKRLSKKSGKGFEEFMKELKLLAKLLHTNLACEAFRLLC